MTRRQNARGGWWPLYIRGLWDWEPCSIPAYRRAILRDASTASLAPPSTASRISPGQTAGGSGAFGVSGGVAGLVAGAGGSCLTCGMVGCPGAVNAQSVSGVAALARGGEPAAHAIIANATQKYAILAGIFVSQSTTLCEDSSILSRWHPCQRIRAVPALHTPRGC